MHKEIVLLVLKYWMLVVGCSYSATLSNSTHMAKKTKRGRAINHELLKSISIQYGVNRASGNSTMGGRGVGFKSLSNLDSSFIERIKNNNK